MTALDTPTSQLRVYISNSKCTISEPMYMNLRKSALVSVVGELPGIATLTLPTENQTVVELILAYLRYGCLPHRVHPLLYPDLELSLRYLATEDIRLVTLNEAILNKFSLIDKKSNSRSTLYYVYNKTTQALADIETDVCQYPVILEPKKVIKLPATLKTALNSVFRCRRCRRYEFTTSLLSNIACLIVAGGCLQFTHNPRSTPCDDADMDFFIVGPAKVDFATLIHQVGLIYEQYFGEYFVMRTAYAVTFFRVRRFHKNTVQIILKQYKTVEQLLATFDIDASCFAYNGVWLVSNSRGLRSLELGGNIVSIHRQSPSYVCRLLKYHQKYGFGIYDPGYIPSRVVACTPPLSGLAHLLHNIKNNQSPTFDHGYNRGSSVAESTSLTQLVHRVQRVLYISQSKQPFILRYNNCEVFSLSESEQANFVCLVEIPVVHSWYAQAYGGQVDPGVEPPITQDVSDWQLDLGCGTVLCRTGLSHVF